MAKNIENMNPHFEEVHEDEARIFKNDKKHSYVPAEQIPDKDTAEMEEHINETEQRERDEIDSKFRFLNQYDRDEIRNDEADKRKVDLLNAEIKIHHSDGAISVGPDIEGMPVDENIQGADSVERGDALIINRPLESMNPQKYNISDYEIKKGKKRKNEGHDNHKKKRHFGNFIKDLFNLTDHREERMQSVQDTIDIEKDMVNLNGRPIDKKITEEKDIAA